MKYERGTIMRWSAKGLAALGKKEANKRDRMVVLDAKTVTLYRGARILASAMYMTKDSFVEAIPADMPSGLLYEAKRDQCAGSNGMLTLKQITSIHALAMEFGWRLLRMPVAPPEKPKYTNLQICRAIDYMISLADAAGRSNKRDPMPDEFNLGRELLNKLKRDPAAARRVLVR